MNRQQLEHVRNCHVQREEADIVYNNMYVSSSETLNFILILYYVL